MGWTRNLILIITKANMKAKENLRNITITTIQVVVTFMTLVLVGILWEIEEKLALGDLEFREGSPYPLISRLRWTILGCLIHHPEVRTVIYLRRRRILIHWMALTLRHP